MNKHLNVPTFVRALICVYMCMHVYVYVCMCMCMCVCVCVHVATCVCLVYGCVYKYICIYHRMIITGWRKALQNSDLWSLNPRDKSQTVAPQLSSTWQHELDKTG